MPFPFSLVYINNHELMGGRDISTLGFANDGTTNTLGRTVAIRQYLMDRNRFKTNAFENLPQGEVCVNKHKTRYYVATNENDLRVQMSVAGNGPGFETQATAELSLRDNLQKIYKVRIYYAKRITLIKNQLDLNQSAQISLTTEDNIQYLNPDFINQYGDHFISSIQLGAWCATEITRNNTQRGILSGLRASVSRFLNANAQVTAQAHDTGNVDHAIIEGIEHLRQENESLFETFERTIHDYNEGLEFNAILSVELSPWGDLGIVANTAPVPMPSINNMPEFNRIYLFAQSIISNGGNYNATPQGINYQAAAQEIINYLSDEDQISTLLKQNISVVFTSPLIFPLFYALKNIHESGNTFINNTTLLDAHIKNIIREPTHNEPLWLNIVPQSLANNPQKILMIDWTLEGWVRLPCRLESIPNASACWRFRPVDQGKYFVIDTQKRPGHYLCMLNDDQGRLMTWRHRVQNHEDITDPQSLWIITPTYNPSGDMTFRLSTKKWPRCYIYVHDQGLEWIHGSFHIAEPRGLFYLRPSMQNANILPNDEATPLINAGQHTFGHGGLTN